MNIEKLIPQPIRREPFLRKRMYVIPNTSGCYALSSLDETVLYVGLANNLQRRFGQHLDSPEKCASTTHGRVVLFHWIESLEINKIERTWMNIHIQNEGRRPVLNKIDSPVSI